MAELRVRTIDESELTTVLAEDLEFDGAVEFSEPLLVKGKLSGEVESRSHFYVAASADLHANVRASLISIKGRVHGDLVASERVELFNGASIRGNVSTPDLIVQSGGLLDGTCTMAGSPGADDDPHEQAAHE